MRTVIERLGHSTEGGFILYDDRPQTYEAAEAICGHKLDRRKNYAIIQGKVCGSVYFTTACSGCVGDDDFVSPSRGGGCAECGYTGKVRQSNWIPIEYL